MMEGLAERMEKLEAAHAAAAQHHEGHPSDWFSRLVSSKFSRLIGLLSSAAATISLLYSLALGILERMPLPPGSAPAWTLWELVHPALPVAAATAVITLLILASYRIKSKSARLRFVRTIMVCYSAAILLYMAWLSLAFLRYNTLPSGVLLALTWVGIALILHRVPAELGEMRELIQIQLGKETEQKQAPLPTPPPESV